jgi:hypothetical protein
MKLAMTLSLIIFVVIGFSSVNIVTSATELQSDEKLQQSSNTSQLNTESDVEGSNLGEQFAAVVTPSDIDVHHGTWHPCKDDPDACGAGVCCAGHCYYQGTVCP